MRLVHRNSAYKRDNAPSTYSQVSKSTCIKEKNATFALALIREALKEGNSLIRIGM